MVTLDQTEHSASNMMACVHVYQCYMSQKKTKKKFNMHVAHRFVSGAVENNFMRYF